MFPLQMTWTFIDSVCLEWPRKLFILREDRTHHTFLYSLSSRSPAFRPTPSILPDMQPVRPYCHYLRHLFGASLNESSSLGFLNIVRGVMLRFSLVIWTIFAIIVIRVVLLSLCFFFLSFMFRNHFYFCYLLKITIMQITF